jgi:hypothetical protein
MKVGGEDCGSVLLAFLGIIGTLSAVGKSSQASRNAPTLSLMREERMKLGSHLPNPNTRRSMKTNQMHPKVAKLPAVGTPSMDDVLIITEHLEIKVKTSFPFRAIAGFSLFVENIGRCFEVKTGNTRRAGLFAERMRCVAMDQGRN